MRALKTLAIILAAVALLVLGVGLFGPKHAHVERQALIAAPARVVWGHLGSLRKIDQWSPFRDMDPGMKVTFEGKDGTVGSKSSWEGAKAGKGMQEITAIDSGRNVQVALHFLAPMPGEAKADIHLEPMGDSTKVTWSYDGENGFLSRVVSVFMDIDKMLGPVFANGLSKLGQLCQADLAMQAQELKARTFRGYTIETVDRPAVTFYGKRQKLAWAKLGDFLKSSFPAAAEELGKAGLKVVGAPAGLYYTWDTVAKVTDVFAGLPVVVDSSRAIKDLMVVTVPAGKALMIAYHGNYAATREAHEAMDEMMKARGLHMRDAVMEEYVTDPMQEPDTAKWLTNIYYPIQ